MINHPLLQLFSPDNVICVQETKEVQFQCESCGSHGLLNKYNSDVNQNTNEDLTKSGLAEVEKIWWTTRLLLLYKANKTKNPSSAQTLNLLCACFQVERAHWLTTTSHMSYVISQSPPPPPKKQTHSNKTNFSMSQQWKPWIQCWQLR